MVEINPLIVTRDGDLKCLDAKMGFDSNALYRQKDILSLRDETEEDPKELAASKFDLNYIALDGRSAAWSTAPGWRWRRWTSSSSTARSPRTSSTSAAARARRR